MQPANSLTEFKKLLTGSFRWIGDVPDYASLAGKVKKIATDADVSKRLLETPSFEVLLKDSEALFSRCIQYRRDLADLEVLMFRDAYDYALFTDLLPHQRTECTETVIG